MTTKELLRELVEELDESEARDALILLRRQRASKENIPRFAGLIKSGDPNLSRNAKRIVREEMGSRE